MLRAATRNIPAPWISFGNRLYKRGNAFFIRVVVPRDLKTTYGRGEICETLRTPDRREAERRCRQRGAEIDGEFAQHRKAREGAKDGGLTSRDIDRIAQRFYATEVATEAEAAHDQIMRDPKMASEGLYERFLPWADSLAEDAWSPPQNELVREVLSAAGVSLTADDPMFPEARDKIVRALLGIGRNLDARTAGEDFRSNDPLLSVPPPPPAPALGITLADLIKRYEQDKGGAWSGKTKDGYVLVFRALKEALGEHTSAPSITRDDCRRVRQILVDLAPNYTKLATTRGRDMEEAARISRELDLPRRKPASVNSYLTNLAALMNYAEAEGLITKSPARGLMLPVTVRKRDKRNPFTIEQLRQIFGPQSGTYGADSRNDRGGRFWVPLLSLWTGMRLNECCQLHVKDIRYMREVPVILIEEDPEGGGDVADAKRVKTEAGERWVPVHPELERLGFIEYWRSAEKAGRSRLFPDLQPGANGYFSDPFSKWFSRYLKRPEVGAYTPKTTFHSFRHNYRDALRDTEMRGEMVRALGGWETGRDTSDDYGKGFTPERLYEAIRAVRYDGLDLSHLVPPAGP